MKTYKLKNHPEPERAVKNFRWTTDTENNARITWQWPEHEDVKYMLAAATPEEPDDPLKWLMQAPERHSVVTRNLADHYEIAIGPRPRRFIFAPAYLAKKDIVVYGPALATDLLYAKTFVEIRTAATPLPFSPYKRVRFTIAYPDAHGADIACKALRYTLHEFNRCIGTFPVDETLHAGGFLHIKKTHRLQFTIEPEYAHLIQIVR